MKVDTPKRPTFWEISHVTLKKKRWVWDPSDESDDWLWLNRHHLWGEGKMPDWPKPSPLFTFEETPSGAPYDTPAPTLSYLIVSNQLRKFFERETPGALAYYPVRVKGPFSDELPRYYACRFCHVWDCLHPYAWDEDENGRFVSFPVLDESKIPKDGLIGSVKHYEVEWLMHDSIKRKIAAEGFTGFDLRQPAPFASRSEPTNFVHAYRPRSIDGPGNGALDPAPVKQKQRKSK